MPIQDPAFRANIFQQALHCSHPTFPDCYLLSTHSADHNDTQVTGTTTAAVLGLNTVTTYNLFYSGSLHPYDIIGVAMDTVTGALFSDLITYFTVKQQP